MHEICFDFPVALVESLDVILRVEVVFLDHLLMLLQNVLKSAIFLLERFKSYQLVFGVINYLISFLIELRESTLETLLILK